MMEVPSCLVFAFQERSRHDLAQYHVVHVLQALRASVTVHLCLVFVIQERTDLRPTLFLANFVHKGHTLLTAA
jgi:hypothetical protein